MVKKMRKSQFLMVLLVVMIMPAWASGAIDTAQGGAARVGTAVQSTASMADIQGRDWVLAELRSASATVRINRTRPGAADVYTLRFDTERLSGAAAPNRYFAPYTSGPGGTLSIGMVAGTLMAPLFENEDLREHEYFGYLNRVNRWELRGGNLELHTSSENGAAAVLVFH